MKGDDIADRLLTFAKRVLALCRRFPEDFAGKHIARQLIRCSSSSGSNYEEARGAESLADFIHKMAVARKEIRESRYWLRLAEPELTQGPEMAGLISEASELAAILTASIKTAMTRSTRTTSLLERDHRAGKVKQSEVQRAGSFPSHE
jgi:four helix bundle protein